MKQELIAKYNNVRQRTYCEKILTRKISYSDLQDRPIVSNPKKKIEEMLGIKSPKKMKRDLSGKQNSGGKTFAEDEQRSMHVI